MSTGVKLVYSAAEAAEEIEAKEEVKQTTVMVVDDSITIRKVTSRMLERNNFHVITAKDGVDAVSILAEEVPDLMLLDIEMPRMDGYELATYIRNDSRLKEVPIIMITSRTGSKHRERAINIGVNKYLGKPYQESELLEEITGLLEEQTG
jgi:chemosensory pili system protein ChpA (sensor histidine kinase/response regulator)